MNPCIVLIVALISFCFGILIFLHSHVLTLFLVLLSAPILIASSRKMVAQQQKTVSKQQQGKKQHP